jgi:hypothetical protein
MWIRWIRIRIRIRNTAVRSCLLSVVPFLMWMTIGSLGLCTVRMPRHPQCHSTCQPRIALNAPKSTLSCLEWRGGVGEWARQ